jgi:hypothetical protein
LERSGEKRLIVDGVRRLVSGVLLVFSVGAFAACGSGEDGKEGSRDENGRPTEVVDENGRPTGVVKDYLDAASELDCERWIAHMSDHYIEAHSRLYNRENALEACESYPDASERLTYSSFEESIDGDEAVVDYEWTNGDNAGIDSYELALIEGTWFIDGIPD